jgi:hypothetical protein
LTSDAKDASGNERRIVGKRVVMFSSTMATESTKGKWVHLKEHYKGFPMFLVVPWAQPLIYPHVPYFLMPESLYPLLSYLIYKEKKGNDANGKC